MIYFNINMRIENTLHSKLKTMALTDNITTYDHIYPLKYIL